MERQKNNNYPKDLFTSTAYYHYLIEYVGNIQEEVSKKPGFYVNIINPRYAVLSVKAPKEPNIEDVYFSATSYVKSAELYTLQEILPIYATEVGFLQLDLPLNLTGNGVNVAILDTGVDYLSEEFMKVNGETRIRALWDQTIESDEEQQGIYVPFGTLYSKEEIQGAIKAKREGKDPYEIVPSKDEVGHGTNMAGIIGATGKNPRLKGVVPQCDFVIVKLAEDVSRKSELGIQVPVFDVSSIFAAIDFLVRFVGIDYKPMVIYFPLGTNSGNHKGVGIIEEFIEEISKNSGIVLVTGAGNQGAKGEHTSGIISQVGEKKVIELNVSPEQKSLVVEIWVEPPNIMSLDIVSPSGEKIVAISAAFNVTETYSFLFERTLIKVNYFLPFATTGDEWIVVRFENLTQGVWKFVLTGNRILNGRFDVWLPQHGIVLGDTRFILSDPYGTITNPGTSRYAITVAAYNQNNDSILNYSGVAFQDKFINVVDIAAGGVNALTVAPDNNIAVVNGTSVAAAIVAGACALLLQWAIVDSNYPYVYSNTIKTYLARGATKRAGDIYPNPQWGYGMLNILAMFQNIL
ncbi:S8 family peptidase [Clostridium cellulovorans]|uniref:Peptidase S8 and S53 subtilisin kexin sedolisin n=1 Tax=Clostridium cellulovorans (strain ATCC 35296 / DSM 3052 / OCM 3 / 743B) TaxID=573061 RepID=D9SWT7_CLOC7|nr:S8 family peptidase [Clostridium cellulovorans]ADL51298.1 peptidase S8 and S53 subtilisin kexin sedolisin [Clostridium cellulovorans 743B]